MAGSSLHPVLDRFYLAYLSIVSLHSMNIERAVGQIGRVHGGTTSSITQDRIFSIMTDRQEGHARVDLAGLDLKDVGKRAKEQGK